MSRFRVDFMVQPQLDPVCAVAVDRYLMRAVRERKRAAVLRVYGTGGNVLSLGRYHLAPRAQSSEVVYLCRRLCGGRALPFGDGFIGISLILPHRSALLHDDPFALAPYQVLKPLRPRHPRRMPHGTGGGLLPRARLRDC